MTLCGRKKITRHIFHAVSLTLAMVVAAAHAVTATPTHLNEMPSARRVLNEVNGKDALDTAARQCAAFDQLLSIMETFEGARQFNPHNQTPNELRLRRSYVSAENKIIASVQRELKHSKASGTGMNSPWAQWLNARYAYGKDTTFVLNKFFSREWTREYRAAALKEAQASEAGRIALSSVDSNHGHNSITIIHGTGTSPSGDYYAFIAEQLVVWAILLSPLVIFLARCHINRTATKFTIGLRRLTLTNITGRVTRYRSHTSVQGGGGYSVGNTIVPVHIRSKLHENIRLKLLDDNIWETEFVNLDFCPEIGDVVTFYFASKRDNHRVLAALNHTTESVAVNPQEVFAMGAGGSFSQSIKVLSAIFFLLLCLFLGIFGDQPAIILWGFFPFAIWLLRTLHIKRLASTGTKPLWNASATDAQTLLSHQ